MAFMSGLPVQCCFSIAPLNLSNGVPLPIRLDLHALDTRLFLRAHTLRVERGDLRQLREVGDFALLLRVALGRLRGLGGATLALRHSCGGHFHLGYDGRFTLRTGGHS